MIKVLVSTNGFRKREVITDLSSTPASVFSDLGVSTAGTVSYLNGCTLSRQEFNAQFADLDVADGDTVDLTAIVKSDGANR